MTSNYQNNSVDLDYTYINSDNVNYNNLASSLANRKLVVFGQQILSSTNRYPINNINSAANYSSFLPGTQVDQDFVTITGVTATSVFYKNRVNIDQSLIRGNFDLYENYAQTSNWLMSLTSTSILTQVGTINNWTLTSSEYYFTLGIRNNGTLWAWGNNSWGQLGTSNQTNYSSPVQIGTLSTWTQLASSTGAPAFILAIQSPGTLWAMGLNSFGQLGTGNNTHYSSPVQVGALSTWTQVSVGSNFSAGITSASLWTWGRNDFGQLGQSNITDRSSPVRVGLSANWAQVACGYSHVIALTSSGTLWAFGYNGLGQLGLSDTTNRSSPVQVGALTLWRQIAAGAYTSAGIQTPGALWMWGQNQYGQLGTSNTTNYSSPVQVGALSTWTQVSVGVRNTAAVQSNGTLWSWGANINGELGLSDTTSRSSPVQVGTASNWYRVVLSPFQMNAIQTNGTLWTCGYNTSDVGQLGLYPGGASVNKISYGL